MASFTSTVVVQRGEVVTFTRNINTESSIAYEFQAPAPGSPSSTLINHGEIRFVSSYGFEPEVQLVHVNTSGAASKPSVENHGSILLEQTVGYATGLSGAGSPGFVNTGDFVVRAAKEAAGVWFWSPPVVNSGRILVEAGNSATALHLDGGGMVQNSGSILVHVTGAGSATALQLLRNDVRIENDGLIAATHAQPGAASYGISSSGGGSGPLQIVNRGTITADDAIRSNTQPYNSAFNQVQQVENHGTINGRILLGADNDILVNAGTINGAVDLGSENDLYDGRLGRAREMVAGGEGADTLLGGAEFDYLQGNAGNDSLSGGPGNDWVVGGRDDDHLSGDAGNDVVYGNLGADTVLGGDGDDWVRGGQDNDSVSGGAGDDLIWGDRGDDTLVGGSGADTFGIFVGAGLDRILDFSLAEGDRLRIEGGASYTVRFEGGDTIVDLGNGDRAVLVGVDLTTATGWILTT
ncbi:MAG: calcium-binding protein [Phenylobacterium sp.]|uniref:calcium-binding protein n=1 Tax=Phenylobacterium sp. TaxID=1871053 RepID=UPI00391B0476